MNFEKTALKDLIVIQPEVFEDQRGYFFESFNKKIFEDNIGYELNFLQDNQSKSFFGVLRGLHYQSPPFEQAKLVRVLDGKVLDIAVDIRKNSPTFGHHLALELSDKNKKQLFIPRGFAHGFITLSKYAIFQYKVDNKHAPDFEKGIIFNDKDLAINWQIDPKDIKLSDKDSKHPMLKNAEIL